ncbi:hypothetical protein P6282_12525 [Bacillus velezensis]|nr:hypothetical protein P6282_12525 [Bacillus velezensis]
MKELTKELLEELERTTFLLSEVIEIYEQHKNRLSLVHPATKNQLIMSAIGTVTDLPIFIVSADAESMTT